jgi:hypothetical protein
VNVSVDKRRRDQRTFEFNHRVDGVTMDIATNVRTDPDDLGAVYHHRCRERIGRTVDAAAA